MLPPVPRSAHLESSQPSGSYWLVGQGNDRRVRLSAEGPLLVGRSAHNHLVLNDYRISRQHARVAFEADGFVVYDLNSANGTFVNNVGIRRQKIKPNDEVRFGPHNFKVEVVEADRSTLAPNSPAKQWKQHESITMFQLNTAAAQAIAAAKAAGIPTPSSAMPTSTTHRSVPTQPANIRDTIPPEGLGGDDVFAERGLETMVPSARESSQFRTEAAGVDLNQLEDAYERLNTMYAFMQAISKTIRRRELLQIIADKILAIYPAAKAAGIYLRDNGNIEDPNIFRLAHFAGDPAGRREQILDPETRRAVVNARRGIFSAATPKGTSWGPTMYAPLVDREDVFGIIYVAAAEKSLAEFTHADLELLSGICASAAIAMQNTLMHEESLKRERINRDLELAAQIQKSFLPQEMLSVPGVEFVAAYRAAYTVGGDFYDVLWVGPNKLAVFIGDISGKGIAASLLMARLSGELRSAALGHIDPVSVFTTMNISVIQRNQPELFFTALYFTLDVLTGEVSLASAGQPSPYLCRADGSVTAITEGASPAIGMLEETVFEATQFTLEVGDSIVLHTDGVVEAAALDGELYGVERLEECLRGAGAKPKSISEHMLRSVAQFTKTAAASDDLTVLICHRSKSAPDWASEVSPMTSRLPFVKAPR